MGHYIMALINHNTKSVYIRIPRTGSSSFVKTLDDDWGALGGIHCSARDVLPIEGYGGFAFLRNPWAWLVSVYHVGWFMGCNGIKEVWPGNRIEPHDAPNIEYGQRENMTFAEFLYLRKTTPMDWLTDGTEILVDDIYRFEDQKFNHWEQKSDHKHWREYYTDETAGYVSKKCWREIQTGGYSFSDS